MDRNRWYELETKQELNLTQEEFDEGWHFCPDWDGMLINKHTSLEGESCHCIYMYIGEIDELTG